MSKLRADITWKHRVNSNINISLPLKILEDINEDNIEENLNDYNEAEKNVENENNEETTHLLSILKSRRSKRPYS